MANPNRASIRAEETRPPIRNEDDSRSRAMKRIEELRDQRHVSDESIGFKFDIPLHKVPEGWEYQWKRLYTIDKDISGGQYLTGLQQRGWQMVPASRHPEEMPTGYTGDTILREGLILMEIPKMLADEERAKGKHEADRIMADKKASLGEATTQLDAGKSASVKQTYAPRTSAIPNE